MPDPRPRFTFSDLFAGVGGLRLALEAAGGQCVLTCEWDRFARKTYAAFYGEDHPIVGDIRALGADDVPTHDVLAAGFPCQPFSLAGVSKKNALGRAHGFDDPTQGTLFFDLRRILDARRPRAILLENVKNLRSHDRGRTWQVIVDALTASGYAFSDRVIDASRVVPQHRERVFIVGVDAERAGVEPGLRPWTRFWDDVDAELEVERRAEAARYGVDPSTWPVLGPVLETDAPDKYVLSDKLWTYLQAYRARHEAKGNGFGYSLFDGTARRTRTISARYHKDGSEALVSRGEGERPRRLTPRECARLQGFPVELAERFDRTKRQPVSDTQGYRQFGNAVAVPVVRAIARPLAAHLVDDPTGAQALDAADRA